MYQILTAWNSTQPDNDLTNAPAITLRGYNSDAYLTGEFINYIKDKRVKTLSVSDIADVHCSSRRDLYVKKGVNKPKFKTKGNWYKTAGNLTDHYVKNMNKLKFENFIYSSIIRKGNNYFKKFSNERTSDYERLVSYETNVDINEGDSKWFFNLLDKNAKFELKEKLAHTLLKDDKSIKFTDIKTIAQFQPNNEIGISPNCTPDFLIAKNKMIGDIKTSSNFEDKFLLTCAGYALAYENAMGTGHDIDWGVIYLFPKQIKSSYVKVLSFGKVFIFRIDNNVRSWFIKVRDEAYSIIADAAEPPFPDKNSNCFSCSFNEHCLTIKRDLLD